MVGCRNCHSRQQELVCVRVDINVKRVRSELTLILRYLIQHSSQARLRKMSQLPLLLMSYWKDPGIRRLLG